ncbi:tRNA (adenosine(37)-N6)-threonylcarbamoyltransferase complex ATPase subunit type 1 TsaE [Halioglobus maricola]|uniref:tRNA (adenosine(37)-N6)-threonylcarbamoyltransferase complex ATPase subunit type 1 TsaE n=1 Tax=Halioglobus maricola TaxID=2601894 RepID=UPI001F11866A|nr:tRNA (adenosine(37)-N6)-threonylcarbamoyltransferase complex ATPase subunit type 1 TsaE [Halioglobus maricola]
MKPEQIKLTAKDEQAMVQCGHLLARAIEPGTVVHLVGDLGMGKTTLSRGIVQAHGHKGAVKSPTYTIVEPYEFAELNLYHFDLYRLGDPEELEFMGIRDYFTDDSICLVEWPERGDGVLPPADLVINIERKGAGRELQLQSGTDQGNRVLERLRLAL